MRMPGDWKLEDNRVPILPNVALDQIHLAIPRKDAELVWTDAESLEMVDFVGWIWDIIMRFGCVSKSFMGVILKAMESTVGVSLPFLFSGL